MYTFDSRIRYSETDETGRLSMLGIINYMQDCSTFQSEDAAVGVEYLDSNKRAWLLSSWQILIDRYPRLGERITVSTWPTGFRGIYGYRAFRLSDCEGGDLVRANSVWFLYDTQNSVPLRVQPEDTRPYGVTAPPFTLTEAPRKICLPGQYEEGMAVAIAAHHLDTNHHVNNAQYVDIAREAIPEGLTVCEVRADYKKAALLGDVLIPRVSLAEENQWTVALCSPQGEVYAAVWLETKLPVQL